MIEFLVVIGLIFLAYILSAYGDAIVFILAVAGISALCYYFFYYLPNKNKDLKEAEAKRQKLLAEIQKREEEQRLREEAERPLKEKIAYYKSLFFKIGLVNNKNNAYNDDYTGIYLREERTNDFLYSVVFKSFIPLSEWIKKKEVLEMYLNEKIIEIKQAKEDNQIISLVIQKMPLPEKISWDDKYICNKDILTLGIGYYGIIGYDLEKYPHAFIAGETGCGKSNILKCLIYQSLLKNYDVVLIDFKRGVSFSSFGDTMPIYYDYKTAMQALKNMVEETNNRLDLFRERKVDNLTDYNRKSPHYLQRKIVFIDELAELLKARDKEISNILYDCLETLTRLSRAVGIHLIMGIQRPDSTIINGQIKNNVSFRVCGRFVDKEPSRIMIGNDMASNIVNVKGRFIVKDDKLQEMQSFYFTDGKCSFEHKKSGIITYNEPGSISTEKAFEVTTSNSSEQTSSFDFDFSDIKK